MERTIECPGLAGDLQLLEALAAFRAYRDAVKGGAPIEEVRRLWILADSLYQAITDFQALVVGELGYTTNSLGVADQALPIPSAL